MILEEIKKAPGEGSCATPESPDYSNSFDNSAWNSTDDDKTESDRYSDNGSDSDKSDFKSADSDKDDSDKDSDDDKDLAKDFVIRPHAKEPKQPPKEPQHNSPLLQHQQMIFNALSQVNDAYTIKKSIQTNETTKELLVQSWFNELVNADEEPEEHELLNGLIVLFGKCINKFLHKDKITKEDFEGPTFELLKKRFKNSVELDYNIELHHLALTNKIDLANPKGNRFHDDLSKPLPLV
nr:hypothetical protein [Tanacetum cinerariifolium]